MENKSIVVSMLKSLEELAERIPEGYEKAIYCKPGWTGLILELDDQLAILDPDYQLLQCKEKFGGLRYYTHTELEGTKFTLFNDLIVYAENKSYHTCEVCGAEAKLDDSNYILQTICENCKETT